MTEDADKAIGKANQSKIDLTEDLIPQQIFVARILDCVFIARMPIHSKALLHGRSGLDLRDRAMLDFGRLDISKSAEGRLFGELWRAKVVVAGGGSNPVVATFYRIREGKSGNS